MIQVIDIQKGKIHLHINGVECLFMRMELYRSNKFLPIKKKVKGSALYWYVKKDISYNQIRAAKKDRVQVSKLPVVGQATTMLGSGSSTGHQKNKRDMSNKEQNVLECEPRR